MSKYGMGLNIYGENVENLKCKRLDCDDKFLGRLYSVDRIFGRNRIEECQDEISYDKTIPRDTDNYAPIFPIKGQKEFDTHKIDNRGFDMTRTDFDGYWKSDEVLTKQLEEKLEFEVIARFGIPMGHFATIKMENEIADYNLTSLPYLEEDVEYNEYKATEKCIDYIRKNEENPHPVFFRILIEYGIAAPWFGKTGGGKQVYFFERICDLVNDGYLQLVENPMRKKRNN